MRLKLYFGALMAVANCFSFLVALAGDGSSVHGYGTRGTKRAASGDLGLTEDKSAAATRKEVRLSNLLSASGAGEGSCLGGSAGAGAGGSGVGTAAEVMEKGAPDSTVDLESLRKEANSIAAYWAPLRARFISIEKPDGLSTRVY